MDWNGIYGGIFVIIILFIDIHNKTSDMLISYVESCYCVVVRKEVEIDKEERNYYILYLFWKCQFLHIFCRHMIDIIVVLMIKRRYKRF
jgi:hypothetical protein